MRFQYELQTTHRLAELFELPCDAAFLNGFFQLFEPQATEWSINAEDDPRAPLRIVIYSEDRRRVRLALRELGQDLCAQLHGALPDEGENLVGLALLRDAPPRFRFYHAAPTADGSRLAVTAGSVLPALREPIDELHQECGSLSLCTGVGLDVEAGHSLRATAYFYVPGPEVARSLLRRTGASELPAVRRFFATITRGTGTTPRWPKLGVGRSVGRYSGWKFYYFARGDLDRPDDQTLLELVGAGPRLRRARELVAAGAPQCVQVIGLSLSDAPEPSSRWTVYMGER